MIQIQKLADQDEPYRLNQYEIEGELVYGCEWRGDNFQAILDLVGASNTPGFEKGYLNVFGRAINMGDFVYTLEPKDRFIAMQHRSIPNRNLDPDDVMVITVGSWSFMESI